MGNLNCSKCVEDIESHIETNLESVAIINAYTKLLDPDDCTATAEIQENTLSSHIENVFRIQRSWRVHRAKKDLKLLKETRSSCKYFSKQDLTFTTSKNFFTNTKKKKNIQYPAGHVYEGECKGGLRDGYGKMVWSDGCFYEGNWMFGYPSGYGKFIYYDKDLFEGKWLNPFPYVNQSITSSTKSFDASSFLDGFAWLYFKQETADFKLTSQKSFEFILKNISITEKVIKQTEENLKRIHDIVLMKNTHDNKEGVYQGDLVGNLRQGVGKMTWPNRSEYIGQWLYDKYHGFGQLDLADGSKFIGFFKENLKEGVGHYTWPDNNSYIGEWSKDLMNGIGKFFYQDGREYSGEWKNGCIDGYGRLVWPDGQVYEGEWKDGEKHGPGVTVNIGEEVKTLGRILSNI